MTDIENGNMSDQQTMDNKTEFPSSNIQSTALNHDKKSFFKEYLAAVMICFGPFAVGCVLGYSSPAVADIQKPGRSFNLDKQEESLFGSFVTIGALIGGLVAGIFAENLGRKNCMISMCCPFVLGWLLIMYANQLLDAHIGMLYAGRIICGFCGGVISMCGPVYVSEMASPEIRGALGSGFQLFMNIGIVFMFLVGWFVPWTYLALVASLIPIVLMILIMFLPESPTWLIKHKRKLEAIDALEWLRGKNANVTAEASEIEANVQNDGSMSIKDFLRPELMKPFILMFFEMLFQQLSGINAIVFNISAIFSAASKSIDSNLSSVIVGMVMVVSTVGTTSIIDRAGRRILLLISSVFLAISSIVLGGYYYAQFQDESNVKNISWLPIVCVIVFVATFNLGYGPIPWLMMSEVFPSQARGLASSIITALNWTFAFIVTKTYEDLRSVIQNHGVFWVYGAICVLNVLFTWKFVPETKGKTFQEIQQMFVKKTDSMQLENQKRF